MTSLLLHLSNRQRKISKWCLFVAVVAFWLYAGIQDDVFKHAIASSFQRMLAFLGMPDILYGSPEYASGELTRNGSRLITLTFGTIFCGLSLLIIHMYFMNLSTTKIAIGLYICMFIVSILINEAGKGLDFAPLRVVAYRIMTLVLSPMPIILLIPALHLAASPNKALKEIAEQK